MVTYADVRSAQPARWSDVADVMRTLAEAVATGADNMAVLIEILDGAWAGAAASAALARLAMLRAELYDAYPALVSIDQTLTELATAVTRAQASLAAHSTPRPGSIVEVDADGTAELYPYDRAPDPGDEVDLDNTRAALADAVDAASAADREAQGRLSSVRFTVDFSQPPPEMPQPDATPAAVSAWWHRLTPAEVSYLIITAPAALAALSGVPADARDQASRLVLQQDLTTLHGQATGSLIPAQRAAVNDDLAGLQRLEGRLDDPNAVRAYLLDVDAGHGQAIVSIANPDDASNTLTFVPGVGSGLTNVESTLASIDHIENAAAALAPSDTYTPGANLATIGWIDYDAPQSIRKATSLSHAADAAPKLANFETGLRLTSEQQDTHDSVLGYSYGSVVVGATATGPGLDDDDLIVVGSPGTTADRATDLGVDRVWVTVAEHDPIRVAAKPHSLIGMALGAPLADSWFGTNPLSGAFGGHQFASDPGDLLHPLETHTSYFDPGSTSLTNIARIAMGDDADVT